MLLYKRFPIDCLPMALQERMDGIESKHRNRSVEESLQIWAQMQQASPQGQKNCMRFKMSMTNPNKAMRDPVAYRCNLTPHHRTGVKYKVRLALLGLLSEAGRE